MNREVNLTKRIQAVSGWRYCPVVFSANGRVKPNAVVINGQEEQHTEGAYYIEWYVSGKRVRKSVGKDAATAAARRLRKEAVLNAQNNGVQVAVEDGPKPRQLIKDAIASYLDEIKISRTAATHSAYKLALRNFTDSCSKTYLEEIERTDLLGYVRYLREDQELADHTCHNRLNTC